MEMEDFVILRCIFFFNYTATTEIYTLSLHDALPILRLAGASSAFRRASSAFGGVSSAFCRASCAFGWGEFRVRRGRVPQIDRKSTRLNSSHANISYAVFCLKKKNTSTYTM